MSAGSPPSPQPRRALLVGVLVALVAGLVTVGVVANNVAGSGSGPGIASSTASPSTQATATPVPTPTPTPTPSIIPFADCSTASFGPPLAPLHPPADVHRYSAPPAMTIDVSKLYQATITTPRGRIVLCLQPNLAPVTVNNFVTLARNHFYDGLTFHRVEANFVIQGGDPTGGGSGGPGYSFNDEPVHHSYAEGAVAMANSGPNTNGSQFFICIGSQCDTLPLQYNLFGRVQSGLDVAQRIQKGDVMSSVTVAEQR